MDRHRRSSLIGQLLIVFCAAAVLVGAAADAEYGAVTSHNRSLKQVTGRYTRLQQAENSLQTDFGVASFSVAYFAATGNDGYLAPFGPARAQFGSDLAGLRRLAPGDLRSLIAAQARAGTAWFALAVEVVNATPRSRASKALLARTARLGGEFQAGYTAVQRRLHDLITALATGSVHALHSGLWWSSAALAVAVLLVLAASLSTLYTVTRPLRRLTSTVGRLTAGDHAARADITGSGEVRAVGRAVNALADERDRLREQEAGARRLRARARELGLRIGGHLTADDVLDEAQAGLLDLLDADVLTLRLMEHERLSSRVGDRSGVLLATDESVRQIPPRSLERLRELFRGQTSSALQDIRGEEGDRVEHTLTSPVLAALRRSGVVSLLVTPFGAGSEPLGIIVAERKRPGHPWTPAEVDAVESVAADLGRGLNHARLYEAENRLVGDLRELDQVKSDFFATVSHELRAPLTTIEGYVEMLGDGEGGELTPQQRKMLGTVTRSSVRLRNLVEDLFTLSKLETGALPTVMRPVSVAELVTGALQAVWPSADGGRVSLACATPGSQLAVQGDGGQLEQVLVHVLSNAVKFTPEGGHVEVAAVADGGAALIRVSDTGIGIPERDQKDLFNRFARATNATARNIPGTGLGLVIVRTIVANHGGDVRLESVEGAGTTVTIRLPLLTTTMHPLPTVPPPAPGHGSPADAFTGHQGGHRGAKR